MGKKLIGKPIIKKKKRVSDEELEERIEFIIGELIEGKKVVDIRREISKRFGVSDQNAYHYMYLTKQRLRTIRTSQIDELIHSQVAAYEHLYEVFTLIGQSSLAMTVMDYKEKLLKLSEIGKDIITGKDQIKESQTLMDPDKIGEEDMIAFKKIIMKGIKENL